MRKAIAVLAILVAAATGAPAFGQVSFGLNTHSVAIGVQLGAYPELVRIPGYPVYYAPNVRTNYFFYDGLYWVFDGTNWYASTWYDGPWDIVAPDEVPLFLLRVPVRYYVAPPVYFRSWSVSGPPRWGEHWGRRWEEHHRNWDRWNRSVVPPPAPLPTYQRSYTGNRYPSLAEQHVLESRSYHYRPHDRVAQQVFTARVRTAEGAWRGSTWAAAQARRETEAQRAQQAQARQQAQNERTQQAQARQQAQRTEAQQRLTAERGQQAQARAAQQQQRAAQQQQRAAQQQQSRAASQQARAVQQQERVARQEQARAAQQQQARAAQQQQARAAQQQERVAQQQQARAAQQQQARAAQQQQARAAQQQQGRAAQQQQARAAQQQARAAQQQERMAQQQQALATQHAQAQQRRELQNATQARGERRNEPNG
jgi:hypothetical protein